MVVAMPSVHEAQRLCSSNKIYESKKHDGFGRRTTYYAAINRPISRPRPIMLGVDVPASALMRADEVI
jgi:hypothetical protein